ncbi:triose-phosphate isomerase [Clostridium bowmanii]|uniref:triose-phosphate isomerase n=1 Tax=Clostridium bowmanii TaxID=132925 RepID=UPI001C0DB265|nr:triose-phosphate isomerase [Clostridium bowmanii]MBU3191070.1 triose-phosphate isomerase [Clostridium bowmanii]MCA1075496.1 triose-phosphate isomerase [Clostridium bowmanii]
MRKGIIAGNWKMNITVAEAVNLIEKIKPLVKDAQCEVVVCPTFLCLDAVIKGVKGSNIKVGAQNMHYEEKGAFTGEVSPSMLKDIGIDYVIIGHSERRQYFNETDETVNKKLKAAYDHNILPILCMGETLEQRESNITEKVLDNQIKLGMQGLTKAQVEKLVIAYEPIWAIGTGKTATADEANETIGFIRKTVSAMFGSDVSEKLRIQYGGSVKPSTISEQMGKSDIDGGLIGGASLKAEDFAGIVNY